MASMLFMLQLTTPIYAKQYSKDIEKSPMSTDAAEEGLAEYQWASAYKQWSICKALGMSDYHAAGILGSQSVESGNDPTGLEGVFDEPMAQNGEKKKRAMKDPEDYTLNVLFPMYAGSVSINKEAYKGEDGKYYPGLGYYGFTGPLATKLVAFGKDSKLKSKFQSTFKNKEIKPGWYNAETQFVFMLATEESGFEKREGRDTWITEDYMKQNFKNEKEAALYWAKYYEAGGGSIFKGEERAQAATEWYKRFKGDKGDRKYANKILKIAGQKASGISDESIDNTLIRSEYYDRGLQYSMQGDLSDAKKQEINTEVAQSLETDAGNTYSLYERFGPDVNFYRYFGETSALVKLPDHVYSAYEQGKLDQVELGDFIDYTYQTYLSCQVYNDRPFVLSTNQVKQGNKDPRVDGKNVTGTEFQTASFFFAGAKHATNLATTLISDDLPKGVLDTVKMITESELWEALKPAINILTSFAMIAFLVMIIREGIGYASAKVSALQILKHVFAGLFALMVITTFTNRPDAFVDTMYKGTTIVSGLFNSAIDKQFEGDEVIDGVDENETVKAAMWKTAVFEPWCEGIFGRKYEQLYSQLSDAEEENKMPQSNGEDIGEDYVYDSASYTGDIAVPLGGGKYAKNWAAYLYSAGSVFHIDQCFVDAGSALDSTQEYSQIFWPLAVTTARDTTLTADAFRVIDAQMNISPQIYPDGEEVLNYEDARPVEMKLGRASMISLLNAAILLFTIAPAALLKLVNLMKLLLMSVQILLGSILELANHGHGYGVTLRSMKDSFFKYLVNCARIFVLILLYTTLVGTNFVCGVIYIISAIAIYTYT